jgi:hypothetical protein
MFAIRSDSRPAAWRSDRFEPGQAPNAAEVRTSRLKVIWANRTNRAERSADDVMETSRPEATGSFWETEMASGNPPTPRRALMSESAASMVSSHDSRSLLQDDTISR